ncbi:hypothetical protein [Gillisia limnaea]|uniref:DUF4179 domain-containing protein n=1 Tax=Gillisia limnaea (strain DSM 15749 / LMG 21470 / R-8282) TaxID=865937 RepID=H2BZ74_GILLR|nr:hypothetical protein [Gillisia limnaea]EHQ01203.1 hypothetical protein Gilli_0491 [Gillisia limnaea DSM 15749]
MEIKDIENLFRNQDLDIAEPALGHQERFLEKLREQSPHSNNGKLRALWTPILAVAAGLLLIIMLAGNLTGFGITNNPGDLANVSPEMKETQLFYASLIKTELARLNDLKSPETEAIVKDALAQMEKLDLDYEKLKKDLVKSGQDKRVIFAMVSNLQQRIDILNNVLSKIEEINQLKNPKNENNYI